MDVFILVFIYDHAKYLGALLFCILLAQAHGKATLTNNGYEDLVVAISPDIPQDNSIIDNIKVSRCFNLNQVLIS